MRTSNEVLLMFSDMYVETKMFINILKEYRESFNKVDHNLLGLFNELNNEIKEFLRNPDVIQTDEDYRFDIDFNVFKAYPRMMCTICDVEFYINKDSMRSHVESRRHQLALNIRHNRHKGKLRNVDVLDDNIQFRNVIEMKSARENLRSKIHAIRGDERNTDRFFGEGISNLSVVKRSTTDLNFSKRYGKNLHSDPFRSSPLVGNEKITELLRDNFENDQRPREDDIFIDRRLNDNSFHRDNTNQRGNRGNYDADHTFIKHADRGGVNYDDRNDLQYDRDVDSNCHQLDIGLRDNNERAQFTFDRGYASDQFRSNQERVAINGLDNFENDRNRFENDNFDMNPNRFNDRDDFEKNRDRYIDNTNYDRGNFDNDRGEPHFNRDDFTGFRDNFNSQDGSNFMQGNDNSFDLDRGNVSFPNIGSSYKRSNPGSKDEDVKRRRAGGSSTFPKRDFRGRRGGGGGNRRNR